MSEQHSAERDACLPHDDLTEQTIRDGLFVCVGCGSPSGIEQPPVIKVTSSNGRPLDSHNRHLDDDYARELHVEHVRLHGAQCAVCGCCWCCDDDCCAEYTCPNEDCGCNDKPTVVIDITGGSLSPEERAIHAKYQGDDPDGDYYDTAPLPPAKTDGPSA